MSFCSSSSASPSSSSSRSCSSPSSSPDSETCSPSSSSLDTSLFQLSSPSSSLEPASTCSTLAGATSCAASFRFPLTTAIAAAAAAAAAAVDCKPLLLSAGQKRYQWDRLYRGSLPDIYQMQISAPPCMSSSQAPCHVGLLTEAAAEVAGPPRNGCMRVIEAPSYQRRGAGFRRRKQAADVAYRGVVVLLVGATGVLGFNVVRNTARGLIYHQTHKDEPVAEVSAQATAADQR
eukprot:jgi/Chlat1/6936/Chrsp52S06640